MPLGRDIIELFEAIGDRIEVSGHTPTWRVTGSSFDAVLGFASEAYGDVTVVSREDRTRWWPRVTLTVTTDPTLAAAAAPLESFRDREPSEPEPAEDLGRAPAPGLAPPPDPAPVAEPEARWAPVPQPRRGTDEMPVARQQAEAPSDPSPRDWSDDGAGDWPAEWTVDRDHDRDAEPLDGLDEDSPLMAMFAHQEELHRARPSRHRARVPRQRRGRD